MKRARFGRLEYSRRCDRVVACESAADAIERGVVPLRLPSAGSAALARFGDAALARRRGLAGCWTDDDLEALPGRSDRDFCRWLTDTVDVSL